MRIKCPDCGSTIDIDRLRDERAFRELIEIYKKLSPVSASLVGEYVDCFRASAHADMPAKKHLRILKEVVKILDDTLFYYDKRSYEPDTMLALEAMQKTVDTEKRAFRNHNYWKAIMIGMLKKRGAVEEQAAEDRKALDAERRSAGGRGRDELPERGVPMPGWVKKKLQKEIGYE